MTIRWADYAEVEPVVFVVDALHANEIPDAEAIPLCMTLAKCRVRHAAALVRDEAGLTGALHVFAAATRERPGRRPLAPTLHVAAHGNDEGISLPCGFVPWSRFRSLLLEFAQTARRMNSRGLALVDLAMSSCRGFHAARMFDDGAPYPCFGIIGSRSDLWSADALHAYVHSYSDSAQRDLQVPERVRRMNELVGSELFEFAVVPNVANLLSPRGKQRAIEYERRKSDPDP